MRGARLALVVLLFICAGFSVWGQSYVPRIPQRVYFPPVTGNSADLNAALAELPDYLFTEIADLQPIVKVEDEAAANSVIFVETSQSGGNTEVTVRLESYGEVQSTQTLTDYQGISDIAPFVHKAAATFAPLLQFVEPKLVRTQEAEGEVQSYAAELVANVELADRLARRYELSLSASGLIRMDEGGSDSSSGQTLFLSALPLIAEVGWYPWRSTGLVASIFFHYTDAFDFGEQQSSNGTGDAETLLLLPGIGITYRTLDRVSARIGATFYGGYGRVTNTSGDAIGSYNNGTFELFLNPDESTSIFYMTLRLYAGVGYNISPRLAAVSSIAVYLFPPMLVGFENLGYPTQGNSFFFHYFSLGISYRL